MDPRATNKDKITPPYPLPYVSRRALRRVKDVAPIPTACPYCQSEPVLTSNAAIYGREYGDWPYAYLCPCCKAYVGLHPDTDLPLGTLADAELRAARKKAKSNFIRISKRLQLNRTDSYKWLSEATGIPSEKCHFGMFDLEHCQLAYSACKKWDSNQ